MMAAKPLAGALLLSAWLLAHAIFIVNANNLLQNSRGQIVDIQQFIPIRLRKLQVKISPFKCFPYSAFANGFLNRLGILSSTTEQQT